MWILCSSNIFYIWYIQVPRDHNSHSSSSLTYRTNVKLLTKLGVLVSGLINPNKIKLVGGQIPSLSFPFFYVLIAKPIFFYFNVYYIFKSGTPLGLAKVTCQCHNLEKVSKTHLGEGSLNTRWIKLINDIKSLLI